MLYILNLSFSRLTLLTNHLYVTFITLHTYTECQLSLKNVCFYLIFFCYFYFSIKHEICYFLFLIQSFSYFFSHLFQSFALKASFLIISLSSGASFLSVQFITELAKSFSLNLVPLWWWVYFFKTVSYHDAISFTF